MKETACGICLPDYFCINALNGRYKVDENAEVNTFVLINHPINECPILREDKVINSEEGKQ